MQPITIDGAQGEGGGQILRTAAALAARTRTPLVVENIRAGRSTPGLRPQHVHVLEAVAQACEGTLEGASVGSDRIRFEPGELSRERVRVDTGTAASTPLILEALAPLARGLEAPLVLDARGGTDTRWAPTLVHLQEVFCPLARMAGVQIEILEAVEGFYPKGGGRLRARIHPASSGSWDSVLETRGELEGIELIVRQAQLPDHVGERILSSAQESLEDAGYEASGSIEHVEAACPGVVVDAIARFERTALGTNALGEKGRPSEEVGRACAHRLLDELEGPGTVDVKVADQLVPLLLDQPGSGFVVREASGHLVTNIAVADRFLDGHGQIEQGSSAATVRFTP